VAVELTESDAGVERAVDVGQEIVVRLQENRTTGYRWQLAMPEDGVVLDDDRFEPGTSGRPGVGGTRTFRLHATRAGTHRLGARLQRPWGSGDDAPPGLEFRVTAR
jgi:predicted secreted protein